MEITLFQGLWFALVFLLIAGYFVLDGFDLGAGLLYPFVAKNEEEKTIVRRSIGPVWDGNEVWLLTAGGALFAAFPAAYATTFSGFYLAVMLVLFGLIIRAVSVEFRNHDKSWSAFWDVCFVVGSLLPALLLGVAVGNIYAGIPMDVNGDYAGIPLLGLITPFTLLCGLLGLAMFLAQGACWLSLKAPETSDLRKRASRLRLPVQIAVLVLFLAVSLWAFFVVVPSLDPALGVVRGVFVVVFLLGIIVSAIFAGRKADLGAFVMQSISAIALVGLLAASMFPNLVVASAESIGASITAMSAASSETTLMWMTIIACIGVPLVLIYHVVIYRTFRGRVQLDTPDHHEVDQREAGRQKSLDPVR